MKIMEKYEINGIQNAILVGEIERNSDLVKKLEAVLAVMPAKGNDCNGLKVFYNLPAKSDESNKDTISGKPGWIHRPLSYEQVEPLLPDMFELFAGSTINPPTLEKTKFVAELGYAFRDGTSEEPTCSPFIRHVDDYGAIDYPVCTLLVYFRVSEGLEGGNLFIYESKSSEEPVLKISPCTSDGSMVRVVVIDGRVDHSVEPLFGNGRSERVTAVLQVERV